MRIIKYTVPRIPHRIHSEFILSPEFPPFFSLTKDGVCKSDYSNCKGNWNLTDIIKGFISEQYK